MARIRARWIVIAAVVVIALFAIVVGGFLWPRPQWRRGPWLGERAGPSAETAPADTVAPVTP